MHHFNFLPGRYIHALRRSTFIFIALWTILLGSSLVRNLYQHRQTLEELARVTAQIAFEKDLLYRSWNSSHNGVYVPVTEITQPNPFLVIPDRDITSSEGINYTLINPAYMTRQVFELQEEAIGILGHITSLNPIRTQNAADEWETRALQAFESGVSEVSSVESLNGQSYLRFMKPLEVSQKCLACHAAQGYQIGDIRGGISESVPLQPLEEAGLPQRNAIILGHGLIWAVGFGGILIGSRSLQQSVSMQQKAEEELVNMSTHDSLTGLHNRRFFEDTFQRIEDIKDKTVTVLSCDLDNLKHVNDTLGHAAGDQLLQGASDVLISSFRSEDIIARIGGDEFAVVLLGNDQDQIEKAISRVRSLEEAWNREHPRMMLSISIGAASTTNHLNLGDVLKLADDRMYADKAEHKAKQH